MIGDSLFPCVMVLSKIKLHQINHFCACSGIRQKLEDMGLDTQIHPGTSHTYFARNLQDREQPIRNGSFLFKHANFNLIALGRY